MNFIYVKRVNKKSIAQQRFKDLKKYSFCSLYVQVQDILYLTEIRKLTEAFCIEKSN